MGSHSRLSHPGNGMHGRDSCIASDLIAVASLAGSVLDGAASAEIERFVRSQAALPGFRGRSNEPDLYYTMFALWCLAALRTCIDVGEIEPVLRAYPDPGDLDLAHLVCLIEIGALAGGCGGPASGRQWAHHLIQFRREDGGYAPTRQAAVGTLGSTYLAVLGQQRLRCRVPDPGAVVEFVRSRRVGNGFSEGVAAGRPTVVSTAAAVTVLRALSAESAAGGEWLWECYGAEEGGFHAFGGAPEADLLSTAVALFVLRHSRCLSTDVCRQVLRFVQGLWGTDGGFSGSVSDDGTDCEMTFYALLAMGVAAGVLTGADRDSASEAGCP